MSSVSREHLVSAASLSGRSYDCLRRCLPGLGIPAELLSRQSSEGKNTQQVLDWVEQNVPTSAARILLLNRLDERLAPKTRSSASILTSPVRQFLKGIQAAIPAPFPQDLRVLHLEGPNAKFEGGDVVPAPKPHNVVEPSEAQMIDGGVVLRSVADVRSFCIGSHTDKPLMIMGYGPRTSLETIQALAKELDVVVVAIQLTTDFYFHADTCVAAYPHGIAIFADAMTSESAALLRHLYAPYVVELSADEAEHFASNGRLLKAKDGRGWNYFYTGGALSLDYFQRVAKCFNGTLREQDKGTFKEHTIEYAVDGNQVRTYLRFVPMPVEQVFLGGGSMSCITQVLPEQHIMMVSPDYFSLSEGLNPIENEAIKSGRFSRAKAKQEFAEQCRRFELYGYTVLKMQPRVDLSEAVYTKDPSHTIQQRLKGNGVEDPAAFGANDKPTSAVVVRSELANPVRQGEACVTEAVHRRVYSRSSTSTLSVSCRTDSGISLSADFAS